MDNIKRFILKVCTSVNFWAIIFAVSFEKLKLLTWVVTNKLKLKVKYCHILNDHLEIVISISTDFQAILSFPDDLLKWTDTRYMNWYDKYKGQAHRCSLSTVVLNVMADWNSNPSF